jgi:hypothetical protein
VTTTEAPLGKIKAKPTPAKEQLAMPDDGSLYVMPPIATGETCLWYGGPQSEPFAAIVTQGRSNSVSLSIVAPGYFNMGPMDGVVHRSSPKAAKNYEGDEPTGTWEYIVNDPRRTD